MKGRRARRWAWAVLPLICILGGCGGLYSIAEFEVLEPATLNFPEDSRRLVIVNRAPLCLNNFAENNRGGMDEEELLILDTIICNNLNRGLQAVLRQSPRESFHYPMWFSDRRTDTMLIDDLLLTRKEVDQLCREYSGDVVLSLEQYALSMTEHTDYWENASWDVQNRYIELAIATRWVIYLPGMPRYFDNYSLSDTIFFATYLDGRSRSVPSTLDMIREAFYLSGQKYGAYLVPVWTPTERKLYQHRGRQLRKAASFTAEGNWDKAFVIWQDLLKGSDSSQVAMAHHNLAVYYELDDRLDSARWHLECSLNADSLDLSEEYFQEIQLRIENKKEIIKQLQ